MTGKRAGQRRVLLIDDEPEFVQLIKMRLESHHYDVLTAADGAEGVRAALREQPDVIILDVMMPMRDGFEALPQLKRHAETRGIPVIMLTARVERRAMRQAQEGQASDYLIKPVESNELLAAIARQLPAGG